MLSMFELVQLVVELCAYCRFKCNHSNETDQHRRRRQCLPDGRKRRYLHDIQTDAYGKSRRMEYLRNENRSNPSSISSAYKRTPPPAYENDYSFRGKTNTGFIPNGHGLPFDSRGMFTEHDLHHQQTRTEHDLHLQQTRTEHDLHFKQTRTGRRMYTGRSTPRDYS